MDIGERVNEAGLSLRSKIEGGHMRRSRVRTGVSKWPILVDTTDTSYDKDIDLVEARPGQSHLFFS